MAKRQKSISLSFVLLRFAIVMLGCMLLSCLVWLGARTWFQNIDVIYKGGVSNQQVETMLSGEPKTFRSPGDDFLAEYVLIDQDEKILESNVDGKKQETLLDIVHQDIQDVHVSKYTYANGSTIIIRWYFRTEFVNPVLRKILPPFEYLWFATLGIAWVLCIIFNMLWLRRRLVAKLKLFGEVSEKIGAQELDFKIPHAGIREYDQALDAMEHMRETLYKSLAVQWEEQQQREKEIVSLAHDLKTPLTLIGGNAELLLEEELPEKSCKMVETIVASNNRAKQFVTGMLEASQGETEEAFENTNLSDLFNELINRTKAFAETKNVTLHSKNNLQGVASIQKDRLLRALENIAQNAVEHTPNGKNVYLEGNMVNGGWQIIVRDEGCGFSKAALQHATERLWRDNVARSSDGHNGIGLWFAAQVVQKHNGQLKLENYDSGGVVLIDFKL